MCTAARDANLLDGRSRVEWTWLSLALKHAGVFQVISLTAQSIHVARKAGTSMLNAQRNYRPYSCVQPFYLSWGQFTS